MLYSVLVNKPAVVAACIHLRMNASKRLDDGDWSFIEALVELLQPFRTATLEFEKDAACISEVIPRLVWIEKQLEKVVHVRFQLVQLKQFLLERLRFRFYNDLLEETRTREVVYNIEDIPYFTVATTLDPRFRQKYMKSAAYSGAAIDKIKDIVRDFGDEMAHTPGQTVTMNARPPAPAAGAGSGSWEGLDDGEEASSDENEAPALMTIQEEIEKYLATKNIPLNMDPLIWWKENAATFPRLAKVAKCFLTAPAGNQSSETAFLVAKNVCGGNRGRLLPENTRMIHFLRCNLPSVGYNTFKLPSV